MKNKSTFRHLNSRVPHDGEDLRHDLRRPGDVSNEADDRSVAMLSDLGDVLKLLQTPADRQCQ